MVAPPTDHSPFAVRMLLSPPQHTITIIWRSYPAVHTVWAMVAMLAVVVTAVTRGLSNVRTTVSVMAVAAAPPVTGGAALAIAVVVGVFRF